MQKDNRLFDDLAKIANGAIGSLSGLRQDIEGRVQQQMERLLGKMNLVSREEFDAARAMIVAAREEQIKLSDKVASLESEMECLKRAKDT